MARRPMRAPARTVIEVEHGGVVHQVAVKRIGTARRFSLRVRTARRDVVLTMPTRGSFAAAETFARRHAAWIADRLGTLAAPIAFVPGCQLPLRGETHTVMRRTGLRRRVWAEPGDAGPLLLVSGPETAFLPTLTRFLLAEARADLTAAVGRYAARAGVTVKALSIRDTRSRWGSCSSEGALSFSWRLILSPPFVLDYLAAHEVAHRVHLNHSADFWGLVDRLSPDVVRAEAWLKQNGAALHRYGVAALPSARGSFEDVSA